MRSEIAMAPRQRELGCRYQAAEMENETYRLALVLTANPTDAEKVARRALRRAWQVLIESGAENTGEPLLREVVFGALDVLRMRRGDLRGWLEEPLTEMPVAAHSASAELPRLFRTASEGQRLARALDEMMPLDRIILILCDAQQFSLDEAARLAGISRREAGLRLHRARYELQQQLAKRPAARATRFTIHFPGSAQNT